MSDWEVVIRGYVCKIVNEFKEIEVRRKEYRSKEVWKVKKERLWFLYNCGKIVRSEVNGWVVVIVVYVV